MPALPENTESSSHEDHEMARYQEDVVSNGNYKSFEYRGQFCEIKRDTELQHLCGYITLVSDEQLSENGGYDDLENKWGITFREGNKIGIDCAHGAIDFIPLQLFHGLHYSGVIYKNFVWVEARLKEIADDLLDFE